MRHVAYVADTDVLLKSKAIHCNESFLRTILMPRLTFFSVISFQQLVTLDLRRSGCQKSLSKLRICMLNVADMLRQTNNHELLTAPFDSTMKTGLGSMLEEYLVQYSTPKGQILCRPKTEFWRQFWPTTTKPPPRHGAPVSGPIV